MNTELAETKYQSLNQSRGFTKANESFRRVLPLNRVRKIRLREKWAKNKHRKIDKQKIKRHFISEEKYK